MKIGGLDINGPNEALLVLPRGEHQIVFRARAILDYEPFYQQCPEPQPPAKLTKKGKEYDLQDQDYMAAKLEHERRKLAWVVLQTLEPSEIEWDSVRADAPGTWPKYADDLKSAGFSTVEINRIIDLVTECNCLDEEKLKWARESFVAAQQMSRPE